MKKALLTTAAVICFVSVLAACGSDGSSTSSSGSSGTTSGGTSGTSGSDPGVDASVDSSAPTTANAVTVRSNVFVPASLTVKVGDTVTWTWAGGNHDVVSGSSCAPDGAFKSSLTSKSGATFTHTFDKAGSFDYFCNPHCAVGMVGKIVVQ